MDAIAWENQKRIAARNFLYEFQHLALKLIPNDKVEEYVERIRHEAAVKIQKTWRGFKARKWYVEIRPELKRIRAVVTIQRAVREWLYGKRKRINHRALRINRINETNIKRIEHEIAEWNQANRDLSVACDEDSIQKRHRELCHKLNLFYCQSLVRAHNEQRIAALCTQIDAISSLVQQLPALTDSNNVDLSIFHSQIPSEAKTARSRHKQETHQKAAWWKKLQIE